MVLKIPSNPTQTHSMIAVLKKKKKKKNAKNADVLTNPQSSSSELSLDCRTKDPSVQGHFTPSANAKETSNLQPHLPNTSNK